MSDQDKPTGGGRLRALDVTVPDRPKAVVRERPSAPPPRYVAGDEIARGGMGRVALATDTLLERVVAVKQALTLDPEMLRRFTRETKITARLEHPSIVPVYDAGIDDEAPFYVMRRVSGQPLSELILASTSFEARIALVPNLLAAAQAVAHAHSRGIVHRDIKPANILVGTLGETVVIDWGLAKVVAEPDEDQPLEPAAGDSLRTRVGTVFGTPGFMSTGQLRGEPVTYAADVYALGASLYFLLSGRPPHHAPTGDAMMLLAVGGPPTPLAKLIPGVPRELAAIVDTALAYGDNKYDDASAFAEDLRRFSTGQLVAAHHYTSSERVLRFVHRHRAAVVIAVVAAAVIAIGATMSFRRIVEERDRADLEATDATAARLRERDRADQLVLTRARSLIDTNPTEAIALLKDIDPSSPRGVEAQGLASGAVMRGVPWGLPPPDAITAVVELDPTGARMLQTTLGGELLVWDLNTRTLLLKRQFDLSIGLRAIWLGKRILIHGLLASAILDPTTNTLEPVDLPMLRYVAASDDRSVYVALTGDTGQALQLDQDGKLLARLWPGHHVSEVGVTGNGKWITLADASSLVVLDRDGKEVVARNSTHVTLHASQTNRVAVLDNGVVWELEIEPTPKWTKLDTARFHQFVLTLGYRGDELQIVMGSGHLLAWREGRLDELTHSGTGLSLLFEGGDHEVFYVLGQRDLFYVYPSGHRKILLPQLLTNARICARRGVPRIVVVSKEAMLIYDLETVRPRVVPAPRPEVATLYDETTILTVSTEGSQVSWFDLDTGKTTTISKPLRGLSHSFSFVPGTSKVVLRIFRGATTELYEMQKHSPEARLVYDGPPISELAILGDGNVVYARDTTLTLLGEPERPLVTMAAPIQAVLSRHRSEVVAVSMEGELVRGDLAGKLERSQIPAPPEPVRTFGARLQVPHIDVSEVGEIFVAWGTTVWRWTDRLEPLLALGSPISKIWLVGDHQLLVQRWNRPSVLVSLTTGQQQELPTYSHEVVFSGRQRKELALDVNGYYHFVDLASATTWASVVPRGMLALLSERGRRLLVLTPFTLLEWTIPLGDGPLRSRLDAATNATINRQGLLTWPWLRR